MYPERLFDHHLEIGQLLRLIESDALVGQHVVGSQLLIRAARHALSSENAMQDAGQRDTCRVTSCGNVAEHSYRFETIFLLALGIRLT